MPLSREDFLVSPTPRAHRVPDLGISRKRSHDQVDCSSDPDVPLEVALRAPTSPAENSVSSQEGGQTIRQSWTTSMTNLARGYTNFFACSYRYLFGLTQRVGVSSVPVGNTHKRRGVEIQSPVRTPTRRIPGAWPKTPQRQQRYTMPPEPQQAVTSPSPPKSTSYMLSSDRDIGSPQTSKVDSETSTSISDDVGTSSESVIEGEITTAIMDQTSTATTDDIEVPTVASQATEIAPIRPVCWDLATRRNTRKNNGRRPYSIEEADRLFNAHTSGLISADEGPMSPILMDDGNEDVVIVDASLLPKPKKATRFVENSVITGRPHSTKTYHVGLAMHEVPADYYFHRRTEEVDLETDWEASVLSPGYHFQTVMSQDRDYSISDDNIADVLDSFEKLKPHSKQSSEEDLANFFQRFSVGSISTKNEEEKAAIEAAKKAEEEKQAQAAAEEAAKQKRIAEEESAKKAEEERKKREQEEREEAARRAEAAKHLIKPLSAALNKKVDKVMKGTSPQAEVTPEPGTRLTRRDMGFILPTAHFDDPSGWLNDDTINLYLTKLCEKAHANIGHPKDKKPSKFVAFSSHLISKVAKDGAKSVSRWAKRAGLASSDAILHTEKILFPCNLNSIHWTLLALTPKERKIEYFDSLGGIGTNEIKAVRAWLADALGTLYRADEWTEIHGNSARQSNGSDCGVFTVFNALAVVRGVEPKTAIRAELMPAARRQMVGTLISGGFVGEFDW